MKRILVTGGNGTIGLPLCRELISRGHAVISLDLYHRWDEEGLSVKNTPSESKHTPYVRCDVAEYRQLEQVMDQQGPFDYVYHAAAEFGRWNGEDYYENLWRTNVIGTKHLLRLQAIHRFRLIHFSSSEVYGNWPEIMVETVPDSHAIALLNDYAITKWANEVQIRNAAKYWNTESLIVRLFNTYGPGELYTPYRSVNCRFLYRALHRKPFTVYRGHSRTSTYLPDTIRTLANIVDHFRSGETYNIGGDVEHTIETLADLVLKVTGADPNLIIYQYPEAMTTLTKKVDVSKSVRDLQHRNTVSLEEGLKLTADWMRKVYQL